MIHAWDKARVISEIECFVPIYLLDEKKKRQKNMQQFISTGTLREFIFIKNTTLLTLVFTSTRVSPAADRKTILFFDILLYFI